MREIHMRAAKKERRQNVFSILSIVGGIISLFAIPASIFWLIGLNSGADFADVEKDLIFTLPKLNIDPSIVTIGVVALLLLVTDTLVRKRIWEKKHKH